jgi:hypothetical protein
MFVCIFVILFFILASWGTNKFTLYFPLSVAQLAVARRSTQYYSVLYEAGCVVIRTIRLIKGWYNISIPNFEFIVPYYIP